MYSLSQLSRALSSPGYFVREFNRIAHRRFNTWGYNEKGIDLFAEDWDNLIILDACRYDMFEEQHSLPGELESRISRGAATKEFLEANFQNRDLQDTVYVTANPVLHRNRESIQPSLHAWIDVWQEDGWDEECKTVRPETMVEYGLRAAEEYQNKRLILHFIQPHFPFIGPTGRRHFELDSLMCQVWEHIGSDDFDIDDETIWQAFDENLELVLPHVEQLLAELTGKSVVTADHGQLVGERVNPIPVRAYGHPVGIYVDELVKVPWLISQNGARRTITAEESTETRTTVDEETVTDRLEQLGYVE